MPTPKTQRKLPSGMTALSNQLDDFNDHDKILDSPSIGKTLCPSGYKLHLIKVEQCFANWKVARYSTFQQLLKQS